MAHKSGRDRSCFRIGRDWLAAFVWLGPTTCRSSAGASLRVIPPIKNDAHAGVVLSLLGLDVAARPSAYTSLAVSTISSTAASALDTGQPALACVAKSWNLASSMPGILASQFNSILLIVGPAPRCTDAVV